MTCFRLHAFAAIAVMCPMFALTGCVVGAAAGDAGSGGGSSDAGTFADATSYVPPTPTPAGGGGVYMVDDTMASPDVCPASSIIAPACLEPLVEGESALCNQLDDDCDGDIDEGCECEVGAVQRCFAGPPGRRDIGACQDGSQTCLSNGEFGGLWGPCEGGISPGAEICDDLDNDCNGCRDELPDCEPDGSCPGPDDPRVPPATPFSTYTLAGAEFYDMADATSWSWQVAGSPCDRMFAAIPGSTATPENGQLSFTLRNANTPNPEIDFTLSGDYTVTLTVTRADGSEFTCTFIVHVRAPGMRVELCWDATGPTASDGFGGTVDLDLHLARMGTTPEWFDDDDCDYMTCKANSFSRLDWGYTDSPLANCTGPGARGDATDACPNPRLDIDNISQSSEYVPENINLDNPNDGDQFRVMVHHYTSTTRVAHPLVNVYCGGELRATYGSAPDLVEGFDEGGGRGGGDMWRVADIITRVDSSGMTDCDLTPLSPPGSTTGGYWITTDDSSL